MVKTFTNKEELAHDFAKILQAEIEAKEAVYVALSGGSTPKLVFNVLAKEYSNSIKWDKIRFFWGDERCVSPTDNDSNFRMTKEHLFDHLPIPKDHIFRVLGELDPIEACEQYANTIKKELPFENGWPKFDLMILGMGDDGHTASIFPHEIKLWNSPHICEIATHPESGQKRVTLSGSVINNSEKIIFLVTGKNKAEKTAQIVLRQHDYKKYPAALTDASKSTWMLDSKASARL